MLFILDLVRRAMLASVSSMGTTMLGIVGSLIYPLAFLIRKCGIEGLTGIRKVWAEQLRYSVLIATVWWGVLFSYQLLFRIPSQITAQSEREKVLPRHFPTPAIPLDWDRRYAAPGAPVPAAVPYFIPDYGNLKQRTFDLANEIDELDKLREAQWQDDHLYPNPKTSDEATRWAQGNNEWFRGPVHDDLVQRVKDIRNELAQFHFVDLQLNQFLDADDRRIQERRDHPQFFREQDTWMPAGEMKMVAGRLRVVASSMPDKQASAATPDSSDQITVQVGPDVDSKYAFETRFILTNHNPSEITGARYVCTIQNFDASKSMLTLNKSINMVLTASGPIEDLPSGDSRSLYCDFVEADFMVQSIQEPIVIIDVIYKYKNVNTHRGFRFFTKRRPDGTYAWLPGGAG